MKWHRYFERQIEDISIPRQSLCAVVGIHTTALAQYLRTGRGLNQAKIDRLRSLLQKLGHAVSLYRIRFDLGDPDNVTCLIESVEAAEKGEGEGGTAEERVAWLLSNGSLSEQRGLFEGLRVSIGQSAK